MAKFDLKFLDCINENEFIKVNADKRNEFIEIYSESQGESSFIVLDKSTAIKFAKTLRTEINKITESEVDNGRK